MTGEGRWTMDEGRRRSEIRGQQLHIKSAKDLKVYQKAYALAMEIFQLSKSWPSEEKSASYHRMQTNWIYARLNAQQARQILASQNRPLTSDLCSLIFRLDGNYEHIFAMLNAMEKKADTFCRPSS